jgi:predicted ATP-grasp superfamily ATP-dependent carboligase
MYDDERAVELGRRLFAHICLEGLGNVEFKHDVRDGQLKLIECNHRLTAATELIQRSGVDIVGAVYEQAVGRPEPFAGPSHMRWMWYPGNDLLSAAGISRRAVADWLTVPLRRPVLPYWHPSDPGPSLQHTFSWLRDYVARRRAVSARR